ncbi:MAG: heparan-alpha-glucosaminide N-acetyltransferase domain-containing protein [Bacteroidota bacterium]
MLRAEVESVSVPNKTKRLYFIDAMRAWAILMMLQGHFIDGLLDMDFRDNSDFGYTIWKYFRGITAPVFFTVSGFIFTYLLIRVPQRGWDNPRVGKGIKRGLQLLCIGYLLRVNLFGLFQGEIYDSFYLVDVLHCIGLSLLGIVGIYLLTFKLGKWALPCVLLGTTFVLFLLEPVYKEFTYPLLPDALANYFTKSNGSVFTILPWFGYTTLGAFLSILFTRFRNFGHLYTVAIGLCFLVGSALIFYSSDLFHKLYTSTGIQLFADIYFNNYLFIRLGDVFVVFALFMTFRSLMNNIVLLKIGQSTLSIYVIHFIVLYGSFTGLGLYRFFHHSLHPWVAILGAIGFMVLCSFLALKYEVEKEEIKGKIRWVSLFMKERTTSLLREFKRFLLNLLHRILRLFGLAKN